MPGLDWKNSTGKFFLALLLAFILLLFAGAARAWGGQQVKILLNGEEIEPDVPPYINEDSRTMVPIRFVSEALGSQVDWDEGERKVSIRGRAVLIELWIGQKTVTVNGESREMDTVAVIKDGRTMVPLRFLSEFLGMNVSWDGATRTVSLTSLPLPPPSLPEKRLVATVAGSVVNVRTGPDTSFPRLTQVRAGTRLVVTGHSGDWYQVELPGGQKGWIAGWLVEVMEIEEEKEEIKEETGVNGKLLPPSLPFPCSAVIMKDVVNVRSLPGQDSPVIGKVTYGQKLKIIEEQSNWYRVELPDGRSGWIAGWLAAVNYYPEIRVPPGSGYAGGEIGRWGTGGTPGDADPGQPLLITGLLVETAGEGVILTVSASVPQELPLFFRLENPSRLVFDFRGSLSLNGQVPAFQVNHGPVVRVRTAQFNPETVRVVFDLQDAAEYALSRDEDGRRIKIQVKPLSGGRTVVIDPGHGTINHWGSDPGAIGPTGLKERDVVMNISLYLGHILLREGFPVIFTRKGDTALTLPERVQVAAVTGADLLISIHTNASLNPRMSGTMTFYHSSQDPELVFQSNSRKTLAALIQAELVTSLQRENMGVREANFLILRESPVPSALIETAFISNPEEEKLLADPGFQKLAAEAIARGIKAYFARH